MTTGPVKLSLTGILILLLMSNCQASSTNSMEREIHGCINSAAITTRRLARHLPVVLYRTDSKALLMDGEIWEQFHCMRLELVSSLQRLVQVSDLDEKQKCAVASMRYLYFARCLFEECATSLSLHQLDEMYSLFTHMSLYLRALSYTIHRYQMNELTSTW